MGRGVYKECVECEGISEISQCSVADNGQATINSTIQKKPTDAHRAHCITSNKYLMIICVATSLKILPTNQYRSNFLKVLKNHGNAVLLKSLSVKGSTVTEFF